MKKLFVFVFAFIGVLEAFSQSVNYSIENIDGSGKVNAIVIRELNDSPQATFQLWLKPTEWVEGAQLISQDNFSLGLGTQNTIIIKSGAQTATITTLDLLNKWSQLTVTINNGAVKAYVNNIEATVSGALSPVIESSQKASKELGCVLGERFKGEMDEIRVWNKALERKDFFWHNTLNKFHPNYDALVAYWKCDQDQCANLVDYKFVHHGVMDGIRRTEVTDNNNFKYRVVTGYTNLMRFTDRPNINQDMFI